MVTTYPNIESSVTEDPREISPLADLRTSWVVAYRQNHPEADRWAEGFAGVEHSLETQERVFRMAEQLVSRAIDRRSIFAALRRADATAQEAGGRFQASATQPRHLYLQGRAITEEDLRLGARRRSVSAAIAGCGVIDTLLGEHGTVVNLQPLEGFEIAFGRAGQRWLAQPRAGRVIILVDREPWLEHLRANGFDPITFDGADPAAFAWAIFELACRAEAAASQLTCDCHPSFRPVPVGVAVDGSSPSFINVRPAEYTSTGSRWGGRAGPATGR